MFDHNEGLWSGPWQGLWQDLLALLPRGLSALALLIVGLTAAVLLRNLTQRLLIQFGTDQRFAGVFLFRVWRRSRPNQSPSQGLANAVGYGVVFVFALASARVLGGDFSRELLGGLLLAAPRLFIVLLMLLLAVLLGSGAGMVTQLVLGGSGSRHAAFWGRLAAWGVFGACVLFTLEPLGLAGQFLSQAFLILLAGAALGLGLAFGLGCKDLAREFLLEMLKPSKEGD
jgi:hypothetical protein